MSDPNFVDPAVPSAPAIDRFSDLLVLLDLLKNSDAIEAAAKQLRELEVRIAVARENLADAKQEHGDPDERAAALDRREAEHKLVECEQDAKFDDARRELVAHHRKLVEIETAIKFRILRHADALAGFNSAIQSVPSWDAIDRLAGAPVDVVEEMRATGTELTNTKASWGGDQLTGTLTRSVPMSEHDDLPLPKPPDLSTSPRRRSRRARRRIAP
jgi:hypothetical protein